MLARLKWKTLLTMAGGLGLGIGGLGFMTKQTLEKRASQSNFVRLARHKVKTQPVIMDLLGREIEFGDAGFNDGWSKIDREEIRLMVPLKGDKDSGKMFATARRHNDKYKLARLELSFEKIKGKKMVLFDYGDQEPPDEEAPDEPKNVKKNPLDFVDHNKRQKSDQQSRRLQQGALLSEASKDAIKS